MSSVHIYCLLSLVLYNGVEGKWSEIVDGSSLTRTTVQELSKHASHRSATIEIINGLDVELRGGEFFLDHGENTVPPLTTIRPHHREAAVFDKKTGTVTGSAGVVTYTIADDHPIRFALVFSVPFDYVWTSNWFGLKWVDAHSSVDQEFYDGMYHDPAWKKPGHYSDRKFGYAKGQPLVITKTTSNGVYKIQATMSTVGRSILKLEVSHM